MLYIHVLTRPVVCCRNLRKWIQNCQNPTVPKQSARPHNASDSYKHGSTDSYKNSAADSYKHSVTDSYKHSAADSYKSNKQYDKSHDPNNTGKPYRDKQKLKQQQFFAQQNQNEFEEFVQFKDAKTRAREAKEARQQSKHRSDSPRKEAYQKGGYAGNQGYSPNFKQDKKQYQILVSNNTCSSVWYAS